MKTIEVTPVCNDKMVGKRARSKTGQINDRMVGHHDTARNEKHTFIWPLSMVKLPHQPNSRSCDSRTAFCHERRLEEPGWNQEIRDAVKKMCISLQTKQRICDVRMSE